MRRCFSHIEWLPVHTVIIASFLELAQGWNSGMFPIVGLLHMKAAGLATHSTNMKDAQFVANSESLACGNPPHGKSSSSHFPEAFTEVNAEF